MTALRDSKGRIKNYLGVQCEVTPKVAARINKEAQKAKAKLESARRKVTLELRSPARGDDTSAYYSVNDDKEDGVDDQNDAVLSSHYFTMR